MGAQRSGIEDQLRDQLVTAVVDLSTGLLGEDLRTVLTQRLDARLRALVDSLLNEDDETLAATTGIDLMHAIHGRAEPEDTWWHTPLGTACARALAPESQESLTHARAAAMLGITRGAIPTMLERGYLDRHPDGGVLRASVLRRLARGSDPTA